MLPCEKDADNWLNAVNTCVTDGNLGDFVSSGDMLKSHLLE